MNTFGSGKYGGVFPKKLGLLGAVCLLTGAPCHVPVKLGVLARTLVMRVLALLVSHFAPRCFGLLKDVLSVLRGG